MPSGRAVANITLATSDSWKDKNTGEKQERTEWHNVVLYNPLAEIAGQYLHKGSSIFIEGRLQTRKWNDKNGQDRYTTEIIANEMKMLSGRNTGTESRDNQSSVSIQPLQQHSTVSTNISVPSTSKSDNGFDDDIPF